MAEYYKGTLIASPIVRGFSGDTYGTHHSVLGIGGFMEVKTIAERNAIPPISYSNSVTNGMTIGFDGISIGQRRLGMLVHVLDDNTIYHLHPKSGSDYFTLAQWNSLTITQKIENLTSSNSWYPLLSTVNAETSGENISKKYTQYPHTFIVGDVVGYNGSIFVLVNNNASTTVEPLGIISKSDYSLSNPSVYGTGFTLTYAGNISTVNIKDVNNNVISGGTVYYLSSTNGKLTKTKPVGANVVNKPMLVGSTSNTNGIVLQYRGLVDGISGITENKFNNYTANTKIYLSKTVTGATNIGYFSGKTGIQTINILTSIDQYNGNYQSLYNYYYRDVLGYIRIGKYSLDQERRGYVSTFSPKKSWIWNRYTGNGNKVGWILIDGDISQNIGNFLTAYQYPGNSFNQTEWSNTGGDYADGFYTNGYVALDVNGSFYTGTTYNVGGPIYNNKVDSVLRLRTLQSSDTSKIKITYDDAFVYLSGASTGSGSFTGVTNVTNLGTGIGVSTGITNNILQLRSIVGSGGTTVVNKNNTLVVYSSGVEGGTYNLTSPAVCNVGGISNGTVLTGKTAFELFEMMLVPELCGTITAPSTLMSLYSSGTYEVGCSLTQTVTATFNRGSINPQYCSLSSFRSGLPNAYCFIGSGMPSGLQICNISPASQIVSHTVINGTNSWSGYVRYDSGNPALGSKGTLFCAALPSGCTTTGSASLTGIYPWFYGSSVAVPIANQSLIDGGSKCVASSSGSITVSNYNVSGQYIWFAVPSICGTKTKWQGSNSPSNCGTIPGDLFASKQTVSINSPSICWSGISYDIYISNYATNVNYEMTYSN